ncbi:MAG: chemotaxis protein CheD [Candidatus Omnitrophica bacterium]|nr:chemotaxis protein CheD [Candidatus Omnitrophota bacterium]
MDTKEEKKEIVVGMADIKVGEAPSVLLTNLGSCIGLCLYDPQRKIGGLLHLMMPSAGAAVNKSELKKAKYADTGIQELLQQLKNIYGVRVSDCSAKIFGGAKILQGNIHNIGMDNDAAVRAILKDLGIRVGACKTGGEKGYKLKFNLETGAVACQIFGEQIQEF